MKVAALQMVSGASVQANLEQALGLLTQASDMGVELAALPEYFCLMGHADTDKIAQREDPTQWQFPDLNELWAGIPGAPW